MRTLHLLLALLLCFVSSARGDDAVKAEIEAVMKEMAAAVLAADKEAYLQHVATGDPWFAMEQRHWADQLEKYPPAVFTLSIADGPATYTPSRAEFPMTMAWRIDSGPKTSWGAGGEERWVKFPPVIFRKIGGRWQYCGEKWEYKRGPNLIVRYLPGSESVADEVVQAFPIAKKHVDAFFGIENSKPQIVELFQDMDHLKATVYLCMPDHTLGGWNEPGESIKFLANYTKGVQTPGGWTWAFSHEYGHVATWELGEQAVALPWWVAEGLAEHAAQPYAPVSKWPMTDRIIRRLHKQGKLPQFEQLADYLTCEPELKRLAYMQGQHMVTYFETQWGADGRNRWARLLAEGQSLDSATRQVAQIDFAELDRRWRATLEGEPVIDPALVEVKPAAGGSSGAESEELTAPDDPAALRSELEAVLKRMEMAVLAQDTEGYLAAVDPTDPCFATEQAAWAKDLLRKPPERFAMTLEEDPKVGSDGSAVVKVRTTWRMPERSERYVSLLIRFTRGESGWLYAGENWRVMTGGEEDRIKVFYMGRGLDEVAKRVIEVMPEIRAHVTEEFELSGHAPLTGRVQEVKLYPSMKHLQHSIYLSYEDALGGWNEPGESIKLLAQAGARAGYLRVVLAHEFGHVCSFELGPKANDTPWWILEGVAELAASRYAGGFRMVDRTIRLWRQTDKLIEWERLADFHGEAVEHMTNVYQQGHHMLAYITSRFGRTARNDWMRAMATGASLQEATQRVLGLSFDQLDREWLASLDQEEHKPQAREPAGEPSKKE